MLRSCIGIAALVLSLLPSAVKAEPVTLKLAFFTSDRAIGYRASAKPFLEAVNAEGKGLVEIVLYSGGVLGRDIALQPKVVLDGVADIAFVVPGYTPQLFPNNAVVELPGLFRNTREGTLAYTRLIARSMLSGYDDFVVLGAYVTEPETIHSRVPIASIDDLKGKRVRVNNPIQGAALSLLGATPVPMPIIQVASAISGGTLDAASVPRTPLADYGIKRVAAHHFMLDTSGAPLALLMNRKTFAALPRAAQNLILKYSGEWTAARFIETYDASDNQVLEQLKADGNRKIVYPSAADRERAQTAFSAVIAKWTEEAPRNKELLDLVQAELAALRATREVLDGRN
jgi:TRAP-type C4-dicarboxylate transport system substrate-binding protein